jgi:hypothetical protein
MKDQPDAGGLGAMLRRPAIDPDIPRCDRALLTAPGTFLTPAHRDRPAWHRDFLPAEPGKRGVTIDGAVIGLVTAGFIAVGGTVPLAIGVLVFSGPAGWQSVSSHYALLLAQLIAVVTAVVFGVRVVRFGQLDGVGPAEAAARTYHGRYLTGDDFDGRARALLRRAQDAVDAVASSAVYRDGLVDQPAVSASLTEQEWDIAQALREQAGLRAERAGLSGLAGGPQTAQLLGRQVRAARAAEDSVTSRVEALERYVAEVRAADAAYRDWQQAAELADLSGRHLDMQARSAADQYHLAEIEAMARHARAIRRALRD